jgi:mono/diheme cytochrome c family protein
MFLRVIKWLVILFAAIQLIPYGHNHANPPTTAEPAWDSPQTKQLFRRACYDCHSDTTTWPWYSWVAPVSWLTQNDVDGGRRHLNFTEWDKPHKHAADVNGMVKGGDMPPWFYLPMHSAARLTDAEKAALMQGAEKTLGPQQEKPQ